MRSVDAAGLSGFVRKTAEFVSEFGRILRNLIDDVRDSYHQSPRHMRRRGAKWVAQHQRVARRRTGQR